MRNTFASLVALILSIFVWNPNVSEAEDEGRTLRIMSYNIHHCEGVDGKLDVERIAGVIRKQECDLVALQEVDRNTTRSQRVDQLAELGRLTGLQPYFGKAIDYGGGEYGLGILSRLPIQETKIMQLPSGSTREKRIVIEVVVQPKTGPRFVFACTHLDHSFGENDRTQQINELKKLFGGGPSQAILAGDFNCTSDETELAPILTYWSDVDSQRMSPTIPVAKPNRKIDYIFLQHDSPWSVDSAQVLDEPVASDHLPLVSTLRLAGETLSLETHSVPESELWLTYNGGDGPGKRKRVVLIAAEQEYRSEQSMPMLAKVLAEHHGFDCTVLFSVNENGEVDPTLPAPNKDKTKFHNIPGLEQLAKADCVIWISRFMYLPDDQMKFFHDYFDSGKPLIALRTANHGFMGGKKYIVKDRNIGLQEMLGGTFMEHHGGWHSESTRGIFVPENKSHPILIGVKDIWGTSDVYRCHNEKNPFPADCTALVMGQPLINLQPDAPANARKEPLPVAWTKTWRGNHDRESRITHFTMGSAEDFANEGVRRMTVNSVYWGLGMESDIEPDRSVDIIGQYQPLAPGFNYDELGVKPQKPSFYK